MEKTKAKNETPKFYEMDGALRAYSNRSIVVAAEERHIARWRSVKHVTEFEEEDGDTKIIRRREKWSNELRLLYATGKVMKLTESASKEGDTDGECAPEDGAA